MMPRKRTFRIIVSVRNAQSRVTAKGTEMSGTDLVLSFLYNKLIAHLLYKL